jgi:hypothetical protein
MHRRHSFVVVALALVLVGPGRIAWPQTPPPRPPALTAGQTEAELIARFIPFVTWPAASFANASAPVTICIVGQDPFAGQLATIAARYGLGRPIAVKRVTDLAGLGGCHVLFIAATEGHRLDDILTRTASQPVLTVADTTGFGARGVMINFYRDGSTLRFEVNEAAVSPSGLVLGRRLLRLARLARAP